MDNVMKEAMSVHKSLLVKGDEIMKYSRIIMSKYVDKIIQDRDVARFVEMATDNQYDVVLGFPNITTKLPTSTITDISIDLRNMVAEITGQTYNQCIKRIQVFYHRIETDRSIHDNDELGCRYDVAAGTVMHNKPYIGIGITLYNEFDLGRFSPRVTTNLVSYVEHCKRKTHYALQDGKEYLWDARLRACHMEHLEDDSYKKTLANVDGFDPDKVSVYYEHDKQYVADLDAILNNKEYDPPSAFVAHVENEIERVRNVWWRLGIQL